MILNAVLPALVAVIAVVAYPLRQVKRDESKAIFAHLIVGNTYNYDASHWASDIALASSKAIDAFTLNVGPDVWQPDSVRAAYDAAQMSNLGFKLSISLDMTVLACASAADGQRLIDDFITPTRGHPSQLLFNSRMLLSTFAGQWCTFGQATPSAGWQWFIANAGTPVYFIPNFQVDVSELSTTWIWLDGYKLWNAWPQSEKDNTQWFSLSFTWSSRNYWLTHYSRADDAWYLQHLRTGQGYMTMVSPWFFAHHPGDSSINRYLRGDNFMYRGRWDQLIQNRASLPFVEIGSWNDYGESHYIGPLTGSIPANTNYVNANTDHSAWTDLTFYYATWFKLGTAPTIAHDKVYLWARSQPKNSNVCNSDGIGSVQNADWADELLYVSVFLTAPAQANCYSGANNSGIKTLNAGVNEFSVPLSSGGIGCSVTRDGKSVIDYNPSEFAYTTTPSTCSMNAWTGMKSS
ncbi:hypothetical protein FRC08_011317 [Ceratobasidium sp. 394]|nr:hypothetical protein FRC08_011317 [Ceratobasidium sp. 394]